MTVIDKLIEFGFRRRSNRVVINFNSSVEVKMLDSRGNMAIRFYDKNGRMVSFLSNTNTMELYESPDDIDNYS